MAGLGKDESSRLSRAFLTGKGGDADLSRIREALPGDNVLAQELLQQMQTALGDVPPAGFTPDQWKEIDGRIYALIKPLARSSMGFLGRLFAKLFKSSPASSKAEPSLRTKRRGAAAPAEVQPQAAAQPEPAAMEGMEEMAPIAPQPSPDSAPEEARPAPEKARVPAGKRGAWVPILAGLLLVGLVGAGAWYAWQAGWLKRSPKPEPAPVVQPTPAPTDAPTPKTGPPSRGLPDTKIEEPLPSELPYLTPQPAGLVEPARGLEAVPAQGGRGLPLP